MVGVAFELFPKGGAIVIGAMGGMGMLSAGFLGGPGIGFKQDYFASNQLKEEAPATYARYAVPGENTFYGLATVKGLDDARVGILDQDHQIKDKDAAIAKAPNPVQKSNLETKRAEII